jgi:predicted regulator of Ras-like GTPase activity (Roadblock/LC7/MglB family)
MNFETELKTILQQVEGAEAAALMGFDGIVVAETKKEGTEIPYQELGVEFSRILKETSKVSLGNELGGLEEMVISTGKNRFVFRVLNSEYFILLTLSPHANLGKGRFCLRRSAPAIHQEL